MSPGSLTSDFLLDGTQEFASNNYGYRFELLSSCSLVVQVVSRFDTRICFGPVAPDGYGVAYQTRDAQVNLVVSCFSDCPDTDIDAFCTAISDSLNACFKLLDFLPTKQAKL